MKNGISQASPAVIRQEMTLDTEAVTSERIKSKLQKYRASKEKSVESFMKEYDDWMRKAAPLVNAPGGDMLRDKSDFEIMSMMGMCHPIGGEAAALLSYQVMTEKVPGSHAESRCSASSQATRTQTMTEKSSMESRRERDQSLVHISVPILSEEEKETALGKAMTHVLGILESLSQHRAFNLTGTQNGEEMNIELQHEMIQPHDQAATNANNPLTQNRTLLVDHSGFSSNEELQFSRAPDPTFVSPHPSFENDHASREYDSVPAPSPVFTPVLFDADMIAALEAVEPGQWENTDGEFGSFHVQ